MAQSIYDIDCPKCGSRNWYNNGDEEDLTAPDVEAIRCWSCKHEFFTTDDEIMIEVYYGDRPPGECMIEDGARSAKDCLWPRSP